jgi:hypothetical protein
VGPDRPATDLPVPAQQAPGRLAHARPQAAVDEADHPVEALVRRCHAAVGASGGWGAVLDDQAAARPMPVLPATASSARVPGQRMARALARPDLARAGSLPCRYVTDWA